MNSDPASYLLFQDLFLTLQLVSQLEILQAHDNNIVAFLHIEGLQLINRASRNRLA